MTWRDHDERVIDESLEETFPASDATTPTRPGSLVGLRYAARTESTRWHVPVIAIGLLILTFRLARKRR
jgi:hypothetical protein